MIEAGDEHQGEATQYLSFLSQTGLAKDTLFLRSWGVVQKDDAHILGSADLLAWEWARHIDRLREGKPIRPSLQALFADEGRTVESDNYFTSRFRGLHLSAASLQKYGPKLQKILNANTPELVRQALV